MEDLPDLTPETSHLSPRPGARVPPVQIGFVFSVPYPVRFSVTPAPQGTWLICAAEQIGFVLRISPLRGLPRHVVPLRTRPARHSASVTEIGFVLRICPPAGAKLGSFRTFHSSGEPRPTRLPLPKYPSHTKFGFVLHKSSPPRHGESSAACGRNQNRFSRQDAKNAKKTGWECCSPLRSWRLGARHNPLGFSDLHGAASRIFARKRDSDKW
jgi:hypothetical protein